MIGGVDRRKLAEAAEGESLTNHSDEPPVREVSSDQLPDSLLKGHAPRRKQLFINWVLQADRTEDGVIYIGIYKTADEIECDTATVRNALDWCEEHGLITTVSRIHSLYKVRWSFKRTKEENIRLYQTVPVRIKLGKPTPLIKSPSEGLLWNKLVRIYPFVFKEVPAAGFIDFHSVEDILNDHERFRFFTLRYDFVCCDKHTMPMAVWEYNGSDHFDALGNPKPEDLVKRQLKQLYCAHAGIPYYEINGYEQLEETIEWLDNKINQMISKEENGFDLV